MTRTDKEIAGLSGIPLQRHVAQLVRDAHDDFRHLWRVEAEECPAGDGFIDMVLLCEQTFRVRMAVEVKRHYNNEASRAMRLVFLAPSRSTRANNAADIVSYVDRRRGHMAVKRPHYLFAGECQSSLDWRSLRVAEHCSPEVRSQGQTLDSIVRDLLAQMEALSLAAGNDERYAFVPVIVTNAELRWLQVREADLDTGELASGSDDGEEVPWLRYEKGFSRTGMDLTDSSSTEDLAAWTTERTRSVYVVRAGRFVEFLRMFQVATPPWGQTQA